jgi:hypothetical protein
MEKWEERFAIHRCFGGVCLCNAWNLSSWKGGGHTDRLVQELLRLNVKQMFEVVDTCYLFQRMPVIQIEAMMSRLEHGLCVQLYFYNSRALERFV